MLNSVLWTLDNELDGKTFERLCVDLLYRNGYRDIVPIEPQDGGRDAEEFSRRGRGREGEVTFFQFSLEKDWKRKIRRDAGRLSNRGAKLSTLVFVTNRKTRGIDVDALTSELLRTYGWKLIVYSREWLRLQLEEAHPDLAKKYLGIESPTGSGRDTLLGAIGLARPDDERLSKAWAAVEAGAYDHAVSELRDFLAQQPESVVAWQALAWSQYSAYHYDEALASINRALKLGHDPQALSMRACILAEKGIREGSKALVVEARRLFEELLESMQAPTWHILYNMGNVLSALGEHKGAIAYYQRALKLESHEPMIWKNLASVYHFVGDHRAEMECFDKALELDPLQPETLVSKGVSLLVDFEEPKEAAALLERALQSDADRAVRWPHIWYWLAEACQKSGSLERALHWVDEGLAHQPSHVALKRLKSEILGALLAQGARVAQDARQFWKAQITEQPLDYDARSRLARLESHEGNESAAWELLQESFDAVQLHPAAPLSSSRFDLETCIISLQFLPQYAAFRKCYPIIAYWDREDPLYDLAFAPPISGQAEGALTSFFAVPFGLGEKHINETSGTHQKDKALTAFFETIRPPVEHAVTEAAREFAALVPPREQGAEAVAKAITEIIMFLGLVAIREFALQRGWIASQFLVSSEAINHAMSNYDEAQIQANVVSNSLVKLNEEVGFAPDSD